MLKVDLIQGRKVYCFVGVCMHFSARKFYRMRQLAVSGVVQGLKGLTSAETTYGHLRAGESWGGGMVRGAGGGGVGYHSSDRKMFD